MSEHTVAHIASVVDIVSARLDELRASNITATFNEKVTGIPAGGSSTAAGSCLGTPSQAAPRVTRARGRP